MDQAVRRDRRAVIVGSTLAFVIGATIMILLHESAHAVAGAIQGSRPLQLPFAVGYTPELSTTAHIIALLAGPAFSLVSGAAGIVIDRIAQPFRTRPFWRLVWLWTVFASVQEGLGYLQITALIPAGDTHQAFTLLQAPDIAFVLATVVGWLGLPLTALLFAHPIRGLSSSESDKNALVMWPWVFGTVSMLVLMSGYLLLSPGIDVGSAIAVLAGAIAIGVYAPMSMMFGSRRFGATESPRLSWPPTAGIVLLAALVVVNLVLTRGWLWP